MYTLMQASKLSMSMSGGPMLCSPRLFSSSTLPSNLIPAEGQEAHRVPTGALQATGAGKVPRRGPDQVQACQRPGLRGVGVAAPPGVPGLLDAHPQGKEGGSPARTEGLGLPGAASQKHPRQAVTGASGQAPTSPWAP